MNKPYIVCHMMASVDGRIDCAMTEQLPGVQEYYATLEALEAPTRVSGRVTAELEMAQRPVPSRVSTIPRWAAPPSPRPPRRRATRWWSIPTAPCCGTASQRGSVLC